jgi:hypothetical protein
MDRRRFAVAVLLLGGFFFGEVWGKGTEGVGDEISEKDFAKGPENFDNITLHYQGYDKDRQGPVGFSHMNHARQYEVNCWECHHRYGDGKKNHWVPWGETEKCIACHDPNRKRNGVMKLMTAFHRNCKNCHVERGIYKGEIGAYKECGKCHLKTIRIENQGYDNDKMGPVVFEHRKHEKRYVALKGEGIACDECHHAYVNKRNIWTEKDNVKNCGAQECHIAEATQGERPYNLRLAYHKKCKGCHHVVVKAGRAKNAPYKKCSRCHDKNSR